MVINDISYSVKLEIMNLYTKILSSRPSGLKNFCMYLMFCTIIHAATTLVTDLVMKTCVWNHSANSREGDLGLFDFFTKSVQSKHVPACEQLIV